MVWSNEPRNKHICSFFDWRVSQKHEDYYKWQAIYIKHHVFYYFIYTIYCVGLNNIIISKRNFKWPFIHHTKMALSDLQWYHLKLCLIKYELDIHVLDSLNCLFSFTGSLLKWLAYSLLRRSNGEIIRNKQFSIKKGGYLQHYWSHQGFKGYSCKSGIVIIFA